eukprot:7228127-Prymnesium_polylepis.2
MLRSPLTSCPARSSSATLSGSGKHVSGERAITPGLRHRMPTRHITATATSTPTSPRYARLSSHRGALCAAATCVNAANATIASSSAEPQHPSMSQRAAGSGGRRSTSCSVAGLEGCCSSSSGCAPRRSIY